jgi:aminopeptidase N
MSSSQRVQLPNDVIPSHYALELTPDLDKLEFYGNEYIRVTVVNSVNEITLHSKEIFISSGSFKGSDSTKEIAVTEINYNTFYTTVRFVFEENLPLGEGTLAIKYRGILNGDMNGFYKSTYSDAAGNKKIMASTQFEALDARR